MQKHQFYTAQEKTNTKGWQVRHVYAEHRTTQNKKGARSTANG
jgi:hypothetical protein